MEASSKDDNTTDRNNTMPKFKPSASNSNGIGATIRLANGVEMPTIGFGTYKIGKECVATVHMALDAGYRLLDTAHVYAQGKTEPMIGRVLAERSAAASQRKADKNYKNDDGDDDDVDDVKDEMSIAQQLPRGQCPFITTKVWRNHHGYDETLACLRESLRRLGVNCVDLVLIHWPGPAYNSMHRSQQVLETQGRDAYAKQSLSQMPLVRRETWRALEDAYQKLGLCRAIGVSNFTIAHLQSLLEWPELRVSPMVNQVEVHPYCSQPELRQYCAQKGIVVQAYSSLGGQDYSKAAYQRLRQPPLLQHELVHKIANHHDKTPAQVLLRWAIQHGMAVIPKASQRLHAEENLHVLDFALDEKDMKSLDLLNRSERLTWVRDPLRDLDFD